jgi:hypothetical protein
VRVLLFATLAVVLAWHGLGLWQRYRPIDATAARERLAGGTLDRDERERCLRVLCRSGAEAGSPLLAATAAIVLGDRAEYARLLERLGQERALLTGAGTPWPTAQELDNVVAAASFGEHWLRHFLVGQWLRAGDDRRAGDELAAAAASARWSRAEFGEELARASLASLRGPDGR